MYNAPPGKCHSTTLDYCTSLTLYQGLSGVQHSARLVKVSLCDLVTLYQVGIVPGLSGVQHFAKRVSLSDPFNPYRSDFI